MGNIGKGIVAGFAATIMLSALMVMKSMMGVMPQFDMIGMMSRMMGSPDAPAIGWAAHFMIGALGYGIVFALLANKLPGGSLTMRGIVLGMIGWLAMMVMVMPMGGAGLFALNLGMMVTIMTLMLHVIFGAVLGWTFGRLSGSGRQAHA